MRSTSTTRCPEDHLVRKVGAVLDLSWVHAARRAVLVAARPPLDTPELTIAVLGCAAPARVRGRRRPASRRRLHPSLILALLRGGRNAIRTVA
jgi:hypothetical protein